MSFIPFVFGVQDFDSNISGYPTNLLCPRCHNYAVQPVKRREFLTFWFVPIIPFYWGKQLKCNICTWRQDINKEELSKLNQQQQPPPPPPQQQQQSGKS